MNGCCPRVAPDHRQRPVAQRGNACGRRCRRGSRPAPASDTPVTRGQLGVEAAERHPVPLLRRPRPTRHGRNCTPWPTFVRPATNRYERTCTGPRGSSHRSGHRARQAPAELASYSETVSPSLFQTADQGVAPVPLERAVVAASRVERHGLARGQLAKLGVPDWHTATTGTPSPFLYPMFLAIARQKSGSERVVAIDAYRNRVDADLGVELSKQIAWVKESLGRRVE